MTVATAIPTINHCGTYIGSPILTASAFIVTFSEHQRCEPLASYNKIIFRTEE